MRSGHLGDNLVTLPVTRCASLEQYLFMNLVNALNFGMSFHALLK